MGANSSTSYRRKTARESFQTAAECIGTIEPGMSLFAITRGQWSMVDGILHTIDQVGPCRVSVWTWTVATRDVEILERLRLDKRITSARMVIDESARHKNSETIKQWKATFGNESVRYCNNHAKIATIEGENGMKCLLRGSMNLNYNPRFEQFDLTEGGPDFDLVREIEDELPILDDDCSCAEAWEASKCKESFGQLEFFSGIRRWKR